ncbi:MAG: hypothetical protein IKN06_07535 [Bacteroidales bacterium]|nr:hypothetical protein [Bacteroidales bacterium]
MKKYIFPLIAAIAAIALSGCNKQDVAQEPAGDRVVTVYAALESAVTRVTTGSEIGKFVWEKGDQIGVWVGDEFVPFTLEDSAEGATAGKFTGTVPEGKEIKFAVYPYSENDTYEDGIYTSFYNESWWGDYKSCVHLYAPVSEGNIFKFQHLCAYALVTIKNVRQDCKYAYLESPGGAMFLTGGQKADLTKEYPKFTEGAQEQGFVPLPEDHSKIVIYAPIMPGNWADGKAFKVKFFQDVDWGKEYGKGDLVDEPVINHVGKLITGGVVNRGEIIVPPDIVFEGGEASGLSATIEGGLTWLSGTKIGLWDGTTLTEKTVSGGNVAVGEFEGDIPEGAQYAITPTTGVSLEGTTLKYTNDQWNFNPGAFLFGTVGEPSSPAYLKSVAFKNMGATIRVTLKNIPAAAKSVFLECGARQFFFFDGTVNPLDENPVIEATAKDEWCVMVLPEHTGDIAQLVVDIPILTGAYDTPPWGFKAECYSVTAEEWDWGAKASNKPQSNEIQTDGTIKRGDIFNVTLTFEAL